jgi:glutamyl-tRNA synthetase
MDTSPAKPAPHRPPAAGVTRLAPSPTGTLHLGNARTFLVNWALARNLGWSITLRIEDLDTSRVRAGAADEAIDLLRWLGIDWDEGPIAQSHDLEPYRAAMRQLVERGCAYACDLTRKQIEQAASAPHANQGETRFSPGLRPAQSDASAWRFDRTDTNYRMVVQEVRIEIDDCIAGASTHDPFNECGDFIIWTKLGMPAYQLAVVVDDARQGVTQVVRGDDLLPSAARQTLLYRALGSTPPTWWHLPLVLGDDGRRLAKRHGDAHLQTYRSAGVPAERMIGLLAAWCGVTRRDELSEMSSDDFRSRFEPDMLAREAIRFTKEDHTWLTRD